MSAVIILQWASILWPRARQLPALYLVISPGFQWLHQCIFLVQCTCCFSLTFSKLCDHLAFAFQAFHFRAQRKGGRISSQEKPQLWLLKESGGLALSLALHCYAKAQLGNKSEPLASEEEPTSEGNMSLRPRRIASMLSLLLIFSFFRSLTCSSTQLSSLTLRRPILLSFTFSCWLFWRQGVIRVVHVCVWVDG